MVTPESIEVQRAREESTVSHPGDAWRDNCDRLIEWTMAHLVNRSDAYGAYAGDATPFMVKGLLGKDTLARHFNAESARDVIGLYTTRADEIEGPGGEMMVSCTSKACNDDIDHHGDGPAPVTNFKAALAWRQRAVSLGFRPLLVDTNGNGGYRVFILFSEPVKTSLSYHLIRWVQRDWKDFGFAKEPEAFPKQPAIALDGFGNWVRLFGRHHKRDHWTRFWDGEQWLEGEDAIDYLLDHTGDDPKLIPAEVHELAAAEADRRPESASGDAKDFDDLSLATSALQHLKDMANSYDQWLEVGMCLTALGDAGLSLWDAWSKTAQNGKYEPGKCEEKWETFKAPGKVKGRGGRNLGSIFHLAEARGFTGHKSATASPKGAKRPGRPGKEKPEGYPEFVNFTEKGAVRNTILNAEIWIRHKGYEIGLNEFASRITIDGKPVDDATHTQITSLMLADVPETSWGPANVQAAIINVAYRNRYSPPRDWLDSLEWDRKPRVESLFLSGFGSPGTEYERKSGRMFMLQAACRILSPGCKADYVPVLRGNQGDSKSTGLMALSPKPEWFSDTLPKDLHDHKTTGELLQGRLIVELCELASVNRSSIEATKSFVTRQVDSYREAYGRVRCEHPRTCVFAGTTNEDEFLQDTANRRFLPIKTSRSPSGLKWVADNRDQLWAEAAHTVRGWIAGGTMVGEMAKLGVEIEGLAKDHQEDSRVADPWEAILGDRFNVGDRTTVADCFKILAADTYGFCRAIDMRRGVEMRIARALKMAGFDRKRNSDPPREWYYEKAR